MDTRLHRWRPQQLHLCLPKINGTSQLYGSLYIVGEFDDPAAIYDRL
jgi:hypothetical protein